MRHEGKKRKRNIKKIKARKQREERERWMDWREEWKGEKEREGRKLVTEVTGSEAGFL